jgi:hypothetical protein
MRRTGVILVTVALLLASSCRDRESPGIDFDDPGPLSGFGECTAPRRGPVGRVAGLDLPDGAILTSDRLKGRFTIVRGFIQMTPIAIRRFYEERADIEMFFIEDEVTEAEAFFTNGSYRNFVKARTVCDRGSSLFVIVAPEKYGDDVSIPKRKPPPTPSP